MLQGKAEGGKYHVLNPVFLPLRSAHTKEATGSITLSFFSPWPDSPCSLMFVEGRRQGGVSGTVSGILEQQQLDTQTFETRCTGFWGITAQGKVEDVRLGGDIP